MPLDHNYSATWHCGRKCHLASKSELDSTWQWTQLPNWTAISSATDLRCLHLRQTPEDCVSVKFCEIGPQTKKKLCLSWNQFHFKSSPHSFFLSLTLSFSLSLSPSVSLLLSPFSLSLPEFYTPNTNRMRCCKFVIYWPKITKRFIAKPTVMVALWIDPSNHHRLIGKKQHNWITTSVFVEEK